MTEEQCAEDCNIQENTITNSLSHLEGSIGRLGDKIKELDTKLSPVKLSQPNGIVSEQGPIPGSEINSTIKSLELDIQAKSDFIRNIIESLDI